MKIRMTKYNEINYTTAQELVRHGATHEPSQYGTGVLLGVIGDNQVRAGDDIIICGEKFSMAELKPEQLTEEVLITIHGDHIRALRKRYGMSQQDLSDTLGIPKRTIEDWERGVREPAPYIPGMIDRALTWRNDKSPRLVKEGEGWTLYVGMDNPCGWGNLQDMADVLVEYEDMIASDPDEFVRRMTETL